MKITQNRREFIGTLAAAGASIPFMSVEAERKSANPPQRFPVRLFSKPLDEFDFEFMCECTAEAGIGGFDLTVRPGGKIEPSDAQAKLPQYARQAKEHGLALDMIVTGIVSADDQWTEPVLKAASQVGVTHYRHGYLNFDYKKGIWQSVQDHKKTLAAIDTLNRKYKIHGGYQNHAGTRLGGPVWDLYEVLKDLDPASSGVQYDVRHAMVEGTNAWILGFRLLAPWARTLAIKDFIWKTVKGKPSPVTVPMGEGMVNWDLFFKTCKELNVSGPMTLHVEYPLFEEGEADLPLTRKKEIIVSKLKKDMDVLNGYLVKYELL